MTGIEQQRGVIQGIVARARDKESGIVGASYCPVLPAQVKAIRQATRDSEHGELDVEGYEHAIDTGHVRHALSKHSNLKAEAKRGQEPISPEDFLRIPEVLADPDAIEDAGVNRKGLRVIRYRRRFNGDTIFVEEVRTGTRTLSLNTLYTTKAASPGTSDTPFGVPN